jgi:hypothetical protein
MAGMIKEEALRQYSIGMTAHERFCYENSDGLCCRDLRTQHLKRHLKYRLPPRILFPEYCWPAGKFPRKPKLDGGVHVVYVGGFDVDPQSPAGYQYELASLLSSNGIHFHIYPPAAARELVGELKAHMLRSLENRGDPKFVHIHNTLPADQLNEELSQYHYGLLISTKDIDYSDRHGTYLEHQNWYFGAAKIFDYLDAGLYCLIQNARFLHLILRRSNGGRVVLSLEDIVAQCAHPPALFRCPPLIDFPPMPVA